MNYRNHELAAAIAPALHEIRPPEFTDDSLALRFAEQHAESLRYVAALGKWFLWDGHRWQIDDTLMARHRAREICRAASAECNQAKVANLVASAKTIAAVERLAQADRRIAATVDEWDADPWILNTPGGTINLRSGDQWTHRPDNRLTKITGVAPDSACPTPLWNSFLERITDGRGELVEYLRRVVGYSLTGSTQEHALFFSYGLGANGKTTLINAITTAMGDYHKTAPIETFTASSHDRHPTELAGLRGARLVTANETEEGRRWAESRIKALTGGDPIPARFMRQDFF
jgi:putative DNA primase/helicase